MKYLIVIVFLIFSSSIFSQSISDLQNEIKHETDVTKRLAILEDFDLRLNAYNNIDTARYWKMLAFSQQKNGRFKDSVDSATKAIKLIESNGNTSTKILLYSYIVRANSLYRIQNQENQYCPDILIALELVQKLPQEKSTLASMLSMNATCVFQQNNDIATAMNMIKAAIEIAQHDEVTLQEKATIYNESALIYQQLKIFDKAYEYALAAKNNWLSSGDNQGVYYGLRNLAVAATDMGEYQKATQHLNELTTFSKSHPEFNDIPFYLSYHKAVLFRAQEKWSDAITFFQQTIDLQHLSSSKPFIQAAYEQLALMHFFQGDQKTSFDILNASEEKFGAKVTIKKEVLPLKALLSNNPNKALIESYNLISIEKSKRLNFIKQSFATAAQSNDNNLKQLDNLVLKQQRNTVIFSSLILIILVFSFVFIQQARKKLILKEKEIAESSLQLKNKLLADVSHELRTPLTVLKLQVESLQHNLEDDVEASYDALDDKLSDIGRLISDIYQLAKSDIGALELNLCELDFPETIEHWVNEFELLVTSNNLTWKFENQIEQPVIIDADEDRIKQVLCNLINNSVKYTDKPGHVTLSVKANEKYLLIIIEDSSPSVPENLHSQIFERLYRVEESRSRETGGSGLGLAICKSLIEAHSGEITAETSDLGGLNVTIHIPLN